MLTRSIDPTPYIRPPRVGVASGLSLSKMLLTRVPKKPGPGVVKVAKALAAAVEATEAAWRAHGKARPAGKAKPADLRLDRAFAAVHRRLSDYDLFPADDPDRLRSAQLLERLFPTGLRFLKLPYVEQHAESDRRMQIIDEEGLRLDLDRLVGEVFTVELVAAHEDYGVVLGITEANDDEPKVSMLDQLRTLTQAISDYALQVLAFSHLHPDNVAPAERALAPIDMFRQAAARRSGNGNTASPSDDEVAIEEDYALPDGAPAPDAPMPALPQE